MAGIRLGMGFASEEIVALFNKVKPPYNINQLTQQTAQERLEQVQTMQDSLQQILQERGRLAKALEALPFVQQIYPSDANFILAKMEDPLSVYDYLVQQRIIVRNRSTVLLCAGCLRITVGRQEENTQLLNTLKQYT